MNKGVKLRSLAHKILLDVYKFNTNIDKVYKRNSVDNLKSKDIAFINNISMNTMRYYFHSINIIKLYANKLPKLHERILLCSAITQIVFLDFKDYAVINSTVEVAKNLKKSHSFINAILKKINIDKNKIKNTAVKFKDLPFWFKNETKYLSEQEKNFFLKSFYKEPDIHLVFKSQKYLKNFKEKNLPTSINSAFLVNRKKVKDILSYKEGSWWVQDFSSSFPLMNINNEILVSRSIDLCAAPGGKSFQILSKKGNIILNDKNINRIEVLKSNLNRLKFKAKITNNDVINIEEANKFKFVVLDAPCSSIGTIRKHPEIFFKKKYPNLQNLIKIQERMLDKASRILDKNGVILYMVCSFLKSETTNQIEKFLMRNKDFKLDKFNVSPDNLYGNDLVKNDLMLTLPIELNGYKIDGYFAAFLKKNR